MIAFDTDVLTEILLGNATFVQRAAVIPVREQAVPVIVIEEIIRGRLNIIRQAEAGRVNVSIARAYELFEETFRDFRRLHLLSHTPQAEALYQKDKSDLRALLKKKIDHAKAQPEAYTTIPASAPFYRKALDNIRNTKSYSVILSRGQSPSGALYVDKEILVDF